MFVQVTTNFGDSHLAGNGGLGEKVAVKAVILELVKLLWTQKGRDGFTKVSDCHMYVMCQCHIKLRIKIKINNEHQ